MTDNFFLDVLFLYIYKDVLMGCFFFKRGISYETCQILYPICRSLGIDVGRMWRRWLNQREWPP